MCCLKLPPSLRKIWVKLQFTHLYLSYKAKLQLVLSKYNAQINNLRKESHHNQIKDLLVCIDFKLHFISPLISEKSIKKINRCKRRYYRRGNLKEMKDNLEKMRLLADIMYNNKSKDIEHQLSTLN